MLLHADLAAPPPDAGTTATLATDWVARLWPRPPRVTLTLLTLATGGTRVTVVTCGAPGKERKPELKDG